MPDSVPDPAASVIGPLVDGDCLNAKEFLRRYLPIRRHFKAELINGLVSVSPGTRSDLNDLSSSIIRSWLSSYAIQTPGIQMDPEMLVMLGWNNVPQPSLVLRVLPECGGESRTTSETLLSRAPELMVDFTTSHQTFDLRDRLPAFRENGVTEYLVWRSDDKKLEWFHLVRGEYALNLPDSNGVLASHVFAGLRLNLSALMNRNAGAVMATLRRSLQSSEHAAFVLRLEARREANQTPRHDR